MKPTVPPFLLAGTGAPGPSYSSNRATALPERFPWEWLQLSVSTLAFLVAIAGVLAIVRGRMPFRRELSPRESRGLGVMLLLYAGGSATMVNTHYAAWGVIAGLAAMVAGAVCALAVSGDRYRGRRTGSGVGTGGGPS